MATKRNYRKEFDDYHGTAEQIKNRAKRNSARSIMVKEKGAKALKGKDIDHKKTFDKRRNKCTE